MGKKRIIKQSGAAVAKSGRAVKVPKRKVASGRLYVVATYNNTKLTLTDAKGNAVAWSSAGAIGFSGARKSTPYAAAKVGEMIAERAEAMGMREVDVIVKGVGAGRESAIRSFLNKSINAKNLRDMTPIPHGGVRSPKPRKN